MSSIVDPADAFCQLWDVFEPGWRPAELEVWSSGADFRSDVDEIANSIRTVGGLLQTIYDAHRNTPYLAFVVCRGIELAIADMRPMAATPTSSSMLPSLVVRLARYGRLNSTDGALLFRNAVPSRDDLVSSFFSVLSRVPEQTWRRTTIRRGTLEDLPVTAGGAMTPVRVGFMAFAEVLDDFNINRIGDAYSIAPDTSRLQSFVADAIDVLDVSGCHIGLLPESVLDQTLLDAWRAGVIAKRKPVGSALHWILVGTGPIPRVTTDAAMPPNTAILISRLTGEVLLRQDKRRRFRISHDNVRDWGLDMLGAVTIDLDEWIDNGTEIEVFDSLYGRFAVTVCEDLSRTLPGGADLVHLAPSTLFCPVFDRELEPRRWHESASRAWVDEVGAVVAVVNSAAVGNHRLTKKLLSGRFNHGLTYFPDSPVNDMQLIPFEARVSVTVAELPLS
jgi:hypothetical protein